MIDCETAPSPRFGAVAVAFGESMFVFGGFEATTSMACNEFWKFTFASMRWEHIVENNVNFPHNFLGITK